MTSHTHWRPARRSPEVGRDEIHIWRADLRIDAAVLAMLDTYLSSDERERAGRFRFPHLRDRFVACRGVQREILARYTSKSPAELVFRYSRFGKPALEQVRSDHAADLRFNVSNCGDVALFVVARGRDLGIDVEELRPVPDSMRLATRFFSEPEIAELRRLGDDDHDRAFLTCWTRKEAWVKAVGEGLTYPLDSFDVEFAPGADARLIATRPDPAEAGRWTLHDVNCGDDYVAAVAVEMPHGSTGSLRCYDWIG
jgi:4'-phosphopantetheinyl transferase